MNFLGAAGVQVRNVISRRDDTANVAPERATPLTASPERLPFHGSKRGVSASSVNSSLPSSEPKSAEERSLYEKYLNTKHFHEAHCHECKA